LRLDKGNAMFLLIQAVLFFIPFEIGMPFHFRNYRPRNR
jgi:hypothetical protein